FFDDRQAEASFETAIGLVHKLGAQIVEVDFAAFLETAKLLYEGAWIAERTAAVGKFIARNGAKVHPVTRKIISVGAEPSAVDAFRGFYRLAELRAKAKTVLAGLDALMVPTIPSAYTVAQIEAEPIMLNSRLGTYTNFVNLLDLAGFSVPVTIAEDG